MSTPGLPEGFRPPVDPGRTFDALLGLQHGPVGDDPARATGSLEVDARHHGPAGALHSGVVAAAAEAIASVATLRAVIGDGASGQGLSNDTTLLGDVVAGEVRFTAHALHRGEREWLWTVDAHAGDALVAHSRVTVAVRPLTAEQRAAMGLE